MPSALRNSPELRIAFVLGRNGYGGSELQAKTLVRGLLAEGICVDVYLVEDTGDRTGFGDAHVVSLGSTREGESLRNWGNLLRAAVRLRRYLRANRYHVIHAVMARGYVLAPIASPWIKRPLIVAWRRNLGIHLRPRTPSAFAEWVASRLTTVVVCNSQAVREYWIQRGHFCASKSVVIPNALPDWRFESTPAEPSGEGTQRIVTVGGLKPLKGHVSLIEAVARLPHSNIQLVIIGDGECREDLIGRAHELGVNLLLAGHVQDTRPWLASAALYAHPSESEGMSNAILEAMAAGKAVIATDVGGARDALRDAGIVVPAGSNEAMVSALQALLDNPEEAATLGRRAQQYARDTYRVQSVVEGHLAIYRDGSLV